MRESTPQNHIHSYGGNNHQNTTNCDCWCPVLLRKPVPSKSGVAFLPPPSAKKLFAPSMHIDRQCIVARWEACRLDMTYFCRIMTAIYSRLTFENDRHWNPLGCHIYLHFIMPCLVITASSRRTFIILLALTKNRGTLLPWRPRSILFLIIAQKVSSLLDMWITPLPIPRRFT